MCVLIPCPFNASLASCSPCLNNAPCRPLPPNDFVCDCPPGFYGRDCFATSPIRTVLPGLIVVLMFIAVGVCLGAIVVVWFFRERAKGIKNPFENRWREIRGRRTQSFGGYPFHSSFGGKPSNKPIPMDNVVAPDSMSCCSVLLLSPHPRQTSRPARTHVGLDLI